ncbi:3'-5' ssDNA/RNA exonuclease TatD [Natronomonas pharaonis DSM 2160]|uniref:3'-5' ssDNA/RNA exonuclease TatD n=1 Tax=Natronomonas pharaonis (strain ATCC 35678 / DSM 2160 / CIP 103997 / JCM 8858 / NBRC 14720 / NCIMB 2260 / Gabara) TaxID=348780 RepID=Q3IN25_NATPD|nr:TatD family hydrolase [Natronomonas pharaonis]CAI50481.1 3'-5' ssDNA/RNA exonuclease TatD [Natronomonas pharaonis DSM 2160]
MYDGPILDNHLHLDPVNGRGADAAAEFADAGGTHLNVLNKPSWNLVGEVDDEDGFRETFDITIDVTAAADELLPGRAWPVLGVHPALISQLVDRGYGPEEAAELMCAGIDVAAEYVASGRALAIKSGRPHYDVADAVWEASNQVMRHAFARAAEVGCAVQLHTEGGEDFETVAEWAEAEGLARKQVVKHYSAGYVDGPIPSVIAHKDELERACGGEWPFFMETDFIDDPDRPGAVLGPKTVPKRTRWLAEAGHETALRRAHVETPAQVYGIDTEATLDEN